MAVSESIPTPDLLSPAVPLPRDIRARLMWLAGFLEGEGSFYFYIRRNAPRWRHGAPFTVASQSGAPQLVEWIAAMCGGQVNSYQPKRPQAQRVYRWGVSGRQAIGLMMTLYPFMGDRRRMQIRQALEQWRAWPIPNDQKHCRRGHLYIPMPDHWHQPRARNRRYCPTCISIRAKARVRLNAQTASQLELSS